MKKLYVLTRRDLSIAQQAVQSGHAVAEYLLHNKTSWDNGTLVYLGVNDEEELEKWIFKLDMKSIEYSIFKEPDIGNQITSLATTVDNEKIFSKLRLL